MRLSEVDGCLRNIGEASDLRVVVRLMRCACTQGSSQCRCGKVSGDCVTAVDKFVGQDQGQPLVLQSRLTELQVCYNLSLRQITMDFALTRHSVRNGRACIKDQFVLVDHGSDREFTVRLDAESICL